MEVLGYSESNVCYTQCLASADVINALVLIGQQLFNAIGNVFHPGRGAELVGHNTNALSVLQTVLYQMNDVPVLFGQWLPIDHFHPDDGIVVASLFYDFFTPLFGLSVIVNRVRYIRFCVGIRGCTIEHKVR